MMDALQSALKNEKIAYASQQSKYEESNKENQNLEQKLKETNVIDLELL